MTAKSYIRMGTNQMFSDMQKGCDPIVDAIFDREFCKLVYIREDRKMINCYYTRALLLPSFKFCSCAIEDVCKRAAKSNSHLDTSNRFIRTLRSK